MSPIVQITRGKWITKWIFPETQIVDMGEIAMNAQLFRSWRHALFDSVLTLLFPLIFFWYGTFNILKYKDNRHLIEAWSIIYSVRDLASY